MHSAWNDRGEAVDLVDPLIDCNEGRWISFHSAHRPFGLVSLAPDTQPVGDWGAGYRRNHDAIHGFSHLHEWQLAALPVLPLMADPQLARPRAELAQRWIRESEIVRPGYHALTLGSGVRAELSASCRVGFHRYTAPTAGRLWLRCDIAAELGPHGFDLVQVQQLDQQRLDLTLFAAATRRRPKPCPIYVRLVFDRPLDALHELAAPEGTCLAIGFDLAAREAVQLKAAFSFVDRDGAAGNLERELPSWDLAVCVAEARAEWQARLGRIEVSGGSRARRIKFATDCFHSLCGRGICSDGDGRYSDQTGEQRQIRQIPLAADGTPRYHHYTSGASWNDGRGQGRRRD